MRLSVNNTEQVLTSICRVYKTDAFVKQTVHFKDIDAFLMKLSEAIMANAEAFYFDITSINDCIKVETDNAHAFFFTFTEQKDADASGKMDVIFFKYSGLEEFVKRGDTYLSKLLAMPNFTADFNIVRFARSEKDFNRLYRLSYAENVNFPLLNDNQQKIVYTEDKNVLVQGVAGSGKTNVCIDKIIYSACQNYTGKILYTTFSRGLLTDTKLKVSHFQNRLKLFISDFEQGKIVFADKNKKEAIENRVGIYFTSDDDERVLEKLKSVLSFLDTNVEYLLLEDFYHRHIGKDASIADERYFVDVYVKDIKNHQLSSRLDRVKYLSYEVIYKEIFGVIFGCCDENDPFKRMTLEGYIKLRGDSFTVPECETIFFLARDYESYLAKNNMLDANAISRMLLEHAPHMKYSLAVIDEVQDLTEISLTFFKRCARKVFAVGDALQMINPSYFSFAYLKRLLFEKDVVSVAELSHNYRNTKKIADIVENLSAINAKKFGVHSFVLRGVSVDSDVQTSAARVVGEHFLTRLNDKQFNNYTIVVSGVKEKELLRQFMKKQEILTVAEIKGLEREVVIVCNLLTDNLDKWETLERMEVNRKQADENSVFRYYFNLFYVGVSRARHHIYVVEDKAPKMFAEFFKDNFDQLEVEDALKDLLDTSNILEVEQEELYERTRQFISLEQYENARFTAEKLLNLNERNQLLDDIEISERYIKHGKHREAGIRYWEKGRSDAAKIQFTLSNDTKLIDLIDAVQGVEGAKLDVDIVDFLPDLTDETARKLVFDVIRKDISQLREKQRQTNEKIKQIRGKKKN